MDFEFSSDALMLRDMLCHFVEDEARPMEMKYFSSGILEDKERARLRTVIEQMGLWGITVPEKFGGGGLDLVTACLLHEELGKTFLPIDLGDVPPLLYACQGDQVQRFLTPALAGSRRAFIAAREPHALKPEEWVTSATFDSGTYILNGEKLLSAQPSAKDFFVVLTRAPEGYDAFLLDQEIPGLRLINNGTRALHIEQCQAPAGSLLGQGGQALRLGAEQAVAASLHLGARYVGLGQRLLDMSVEYSKSWMVHGALLNERQAIQDMLAEMQVTIESSRWLVYHAAWLADKGRLTRPAAAQVRLATGEMLKRVTDLTTLVYGGPGPSPQIEVQRWVQGAVPMEALETGLASARTLIASGLLAMSEGE